MNNQFTDFECRNLDLSLGEKTLFSSFNFHFSGPGIVMIEGENGTGKSTLLKVFAGFVTTGNSQITFSGCLPVDFGPGDFSFFTTTSLGLINELTGLEHIELIAKSLKLDSQLVKAKIMEFSNFEIFLEILDKPVVDFSQGMKQLLRFFLHVFFDPKILFLDEPFLYLSPKLKEFCQKKVEAMAAHSMIFVTDQCFTWSLGCKTEKIILGKL